MATVRLLRRPPPYVLVALAAALAGGLVALAGEVTGLTHNRTSTVYVPTSAGDLGHRQ